MKKITNNDLILCITCLLFLLLQVIEKMNNTTSYVNNLYDEFKKTTLDRDVLFIILSTKSAELTYAKTVYDLAVQNSAANPGCQEDIDNKLSDADCALSKAKQAYIYSGIAYEKAKEDSVTARRAFNAACRAKEAAEEAVEEAAE